MTVRVDIKFERSGQRLSGVWNPNEKERDAAWEICVELCTRVPVIPLRENEGLLREALSSLHAIFDETRKILRKGGVDLSVDRRGELSFAVLVGHLLNQLIRPILACWHPKLKEWETQCPKSESALSWEHAWDDYEFVLQIITELRDPLIAYAKVFANACGAQEFLKIQLANEDRLYDAYSRKSISGGLYG
jgi:hypothetical protein